MLGIIFWIFVTGVVAGLIGFLRGIELDNRGVQFNLITAQKRVKELLPDANKAIIDLEFAVTAELAGLDPYASEAEKPSLVQSNLSCLIEKLNDYDFAKPRPQRRGSISEESNWLSNLASDIESNLDSAAALAMIKE